MRCVGVCVCVRVISHLHDSHWFVCHDVLIHICHQYQGVCAPQRQQSVIVSEDLR